MAKRDKPFQNVNSVLSSVWGSPVSAQHQGGYATSSANRVGVKKEKPLTAAEIEAQALADELSADEKAAERAQDPRSAYEKRYNIRNGAAHMTPEQFRNLCFSLPALKNLNRYVDVIHIDDGEGISLDFKFRKPSENYSDLKAIPLEDILTQGVTVALKDNEQIVLREKSKHFALLERRSVRNDLVVHSKWGAGLITTPEIFNPLADTYLKNPKNKGNFHKLFNGSKFENTQERLQANPEVGIDVTVTALVEDNSGPLKLGTLRTVETVNINEGLFIKMSAAKFLEHEKTYHPSQDKSAFIADFFNGASGYILTWRKIPVVVLLPDNVNDTPKPS